MKHKILKFLFCVAVFVVTGKTDVSAQTYIDAGAGYSFPSGSMLTYKQNTPVSLSLGKGVNTALTFRYVVRKFLGFECGFGFLIGMNTETLGLPMNDGSVRSSTISSSVFSITPGVRLIMPLAIYDKMSLYSRAGLYLPVLNTAVDKVKLSASDVASSMDETHTYSAFFRPGCFMAIGGTYKIKPAVSVFLELNVLLARFDKAEDKISGTKTETITFQKSGDPFSESLPQSSIGLTLGCTFKLGK